MENGLKKVFSEFGKDYLSSYGLSNEQKKTYNNINICKTSKLGTRIYKCSECGSEVFSYNSCNDRHCPKCQSLRKEMWINKHKSETFDITYFHVVATVPQKLRVIFYHNKKVMYDMLFESATNTVKELCKDKKFLGAEVGITAMLHTWTQQGKYFPHIHMIVTGGGINELGKWVNSKNNYLIPVKVMSRKFRGKLLSMIKKEKELKFYNEYEYLNDKKELNKYLESLYKEEWVCYSKEPFDGVGNVYEYLGRYAFKVWISDERIKKIDDNNVYFEYRDRKNNNRKKVMKVEGKEFIRRFMMHVLPGD